MTRKDYREIAISIGRMKHRLIRPEVVVTIHAEAAIDDLIDSLCSIMKRENPRFDRARFMEAIEEQMKKHRRIEEAA